VRLRKARGMTQADLAAALGVTQGMVSFYEKGTADPAAQTLAKLARVLDVSADELLGLKKLSKTDRKHGAEDMRLVRRLMKAAELPERERRSVLHYIDAMIAVRRQRSTKSDDSKSAAKDD